MTLRARPRARFSATPLILILLATATPREGQTRIDDENAGRNCISLDTILRIGSMDGPTALPGVPSAVIADSQERYWFLLGFGEPPLIIESDGSSAKRAGRMGDPTALAVEYSRVSPGVALTDRLYWAALGLVGFSIALGAVRLLSHAGTWLMRGNGPADGWFLGSAFFGLALLFLSVMRTARVPHGRIARAFGLVVTRARERPVATAHLAFSALAGLTILDHFASGFIWSIAWPEGYVARGFLEAVLTTGVPIGLLLLTGYLSGSGAMDRGGDAEVVPS